MGNWVSTEMLLIPRTKTSRFYPKRSLRPLLSKRLGHFLPNQNGFVSFVVVVVVVVVFVVVLFYSHYKCESV